MSAYWGGWWLAGFLAVMLAAVGRLEHLAALFGFLQRCSRRLGDWGFRTFGALAIALLEGRDSFHRHRLRLAEELADQRIP